MASAPWWNKHRNQWTLKYRPDPTGPWVTVGLGKHPTPVNPDRPPKKPPIDVQDREREFVEIEYRAKHGMGPAPQRAKPLGIYLDAYLSGYAATRTEGTLTLLRRYVDSFRAFAEDAGVKTVQGVTKAICRDYLEKRVKEIAVSTLKCEKGMLGGIWSRAVEDELIQVNPWSLVKLPGKPEESVATFWTSVEIARIAAEMSRPWQSDLVILMANTGLRISAALAIEWAWIDWTANTLSVPRLEGMKGGYVHILGPIARVILERRHFESSSPFAFLNPRIGQPFEYPTAADAIKRAVVRAGVPKGTPHDLRHSYARMLERQGVPMSVIQRQLGHKTPSMTFKYTSADDTEAGRWIKDIRIGEPTPPAPSDSET